MANPSPIIDRVLIGQMTGLLDWLYRSGVEDASIYRQDEGLIYEYIEKAGAVGAYGFLNEHLLMMSWQEWTLRIIAKARMTSWNSAMARYFNAAGKLGQNYLSVFIPLSMVFYVRGVKDYISYPDACKMSEFQSKTRVFWTKKGLKTIKPRSYADEIQMACFDLQRRDSEIWANNTPMNAKKIGALISKHYDMFIRAVGLVSMDLKH